MMSSAAAIDEALVSRGPNEEAKAKLRQPLVKEEQITLDDYQHSCTERFKHADVVVRPDDEVGTTDTRRDESYAGRKTRRNNRMPMRARTRAPRRLT